MRLYLSLLLVLMTYQVKGQLTTTGFCPTCYQTSHNFTADYIKKMIEAPSGHILLLSNAGRERCQELNFTTENTYNYTYINFNNESVGSSNYFTATPWSLSTPASLSLGVVSGILTTTPLLQQILYPIIARDDMVVFTSCTPRMLVTITEEVRVYVPQPYNGKPSIEEIKDVLKAMNAPQFNNLVVANRNCTLGPISPATGAAQTFFEALAGVISNPGSIIQPTPPSVIPSNSASLIDAINSIGSSASNAVGGGSAAEEEPTTDTPARSENELVDAVDLEVETEKKVQSVDGEKKEQSVDGEKKEQSVDGEKKEQSVDDDKKDELTVEKKDIENEEEAQIVDEKQIMKKKGNKLPRIPSVPASRKGDN